MAAELKELIAKTESELATLRKELAQVEVAEQEDTESHDGAGNGTVAAAASDAGVINGEWKWPLSAQEYDRYGRQLILPNVGIHGVYFFSGTCAAELSGFKQEVTD